MKEQLSTVFYLRNKCQKALMQKLWNTNNKTDIYSLYLYYFLFILYVFINCIHSNIKCNQKNKARQIKNGSNVQLHLLLILGPFRNPSSRLWACDRLYLLKTHLGLSSSFISYWFSGSVNIYVYVPLSSLVLFFLSFKLNLKNLQGKYWIICKGAVFM